MAAFRGIETDLVADARAFRRVLHSFPETANKERGTARRLEAHLAGYGLKPWRRNVGGAGLLYRIDGRLPGPTRLLRADLDALPIEERTGAPHASRHPGAHHACGHDGHTAMLAAALAQLARQPTFRGATLGLFQPAEETGEGAAKVLASFRPARLSIQRAFGIHNFPGMPMGEVGVCTGTAAKPSMGLEIEMLGRRTHASEPHLGRNPIPVLAKVAQSIQRGSVPPTAKRRAFATIVGLDSGEFNFGVSPGRARLALTIRGDEQASLDRLLDETMRAAQKAARDGRLRVRFTEHDVFRETRNDVRAVEDVASAAREVGLPVRRLRRPLSASEDFGRFTDRWPGALILLGAGTAHPPLHSDVYDFPDDLLERGANLWLSLCGFRR